MFAHKQWWDQRIKILWSHHCLCASSGSKSDVENSGVTGGGGRGAECPPETSDREIFADISEKRGKEKREKG